MNIMFFNKKPVKNHKLIGFTLAEVLITLSIIGVIASMTIPSLVQDVQDAQYKAAWKKAYADISQVLIKIRQEKGDLKDIQPAKTLKPELMKHLLVIHDCGWTSCNSNLNYKSLSGTSIGLWRFDDGQFTLSNGTFIGISNDGVPGNNIHIFVDINGYAKGPNIAGKDLFGLEIIDKYTFKPFGAPGTSKYPKTAGTLENTCNTSSGEHSGWGCSSEYLYK